MELIAKIAHAGKTQEAIEIAKSLSGKTLFISNESTGNQIVERIKATPTPALGQIMAANMSTPSGVLAMILGYAAQDIHFDNIVLDVNFALSHSDWFKFALGLEADGYMVVVTQHLIKHGHQSKETLTIRNAQ